jgi:hypothetical protein
LWSAGRRKPLDATTAPHSRSLEPSALLLLDRQSSECEMPVRGGLLIQRVNLPLTRLSLADSQFLLRPDILDVR